jgi:gluconate 5-dehydrogenase
MEMDWLGLSGKRALVLGAGGLGGAAAYALATQGANVLSCDINEQALDALAERVKDAGYTLDVQIGDISQPESARAAVAEALLTLGGIDVFVHAVGRNDRRPVLELGDEDWQSIIRLNLDSAWWTGQAVGRIMCAAGHGRMVFYSSVSGLLAHANHGPYAATKGGINQMMRVMAREWAPSSVTVNAVAPGYIETDLTGAHLAKPGIREGLVSLVPAGRLGAPAEVADAVTYLVSDRSSFVTGQVLYIDGGRTLV